METICRSWFFLTNFLLLLFATKNHFTMAIDTISPGQPLSGNQTLTSTSGNFELGFFTPGQFRNYYIGIWYKKLSRKTIVWVANRETPLSDTSSELKISDDGNLVLTSHTKIPTWSSNASSIASNRTIAILLDNGNLVLTDGLKSSLVFWQSFDYPTDTWLPEQKMGLNKVTGIRQRLISWRNSEDPAPGLYSHQIEVDGTFQYFMMWNDSHRYWKSGVWDGQRFPLLTERPTGLINQTVVNIYPRFVTNNKENSTTYSARNGSIIRIVIETSGLLGHWKWINEINDWILLMRYPLNLCDIYAVCGPFGVCDTDNSTLCTCLPGFRPVSMENWKLGDRSSGCAREHDVMCVDSNSNINGQKEVDFQRIANIRLPVNPKSLIAEGIERCEAACSDDCSCNAYSYNSDGCFVWNGDLLNLRSVADSDVEQGDLYVRLSTNVQKDKKGRLTLVIAASSIGCFGALIIVTVLIWRWRRKLKVCHSSSSVGFLILFRYRDLRCATNNFTEKLGGGSFGSVFKGILQDSSVVAVKKLESLGQGEKEFRSEVSTIGNIQHVNLVRLRGFCSEGSKRLLVYDFMPNGSLAAQLFGQRSNVLGWKTRYEIAVGIAKGLAYLHEGCRECIVHCDIKPENILLDSEFCPKVADFGMAKLLAREFSRVLTTTRGTLGYLAPEWIQGVAITAKADVYSYGMMALEIISGCRNSQQPEVNGVDYFPVWAASRINKGEVFRLLDNRLEGVADVEELSRLSRVACWCIQEHEASRPSMVQVVRILEGALEVSVPPIPRFLEIISSGKTTIFAMKSETGSPVSL